MEYPILIYHSRRAFLSVPRFYSSFDQRSNNQFASAAIETDMISGTAGFRVGERKLGVNIFDCFLAVIQTISSDNDLFGCGGTTVMADVFSNHCVF